MFRTRLAVMACVAAAAASFGNDADKTKTEFAALAGTWMETAAEQDGLPLDRIGGGVMVVKDQTFEIKTVAGTELSGDLRLDPTKKPKTWDCIHQKGPLAEQKWEAIYEVKDDTLKICYAEADGEMPRPDEFKTEKDSKRLFLTLERKKK